jgi:CRISPR/Cas system-associated exonuclease Cas4 (RecB family)
VEDVLDRDAPHGLIRYRDCTLRVTNSDALIEELLATLERMRQVQAEGEARRSHQQAARCARCPVAHACPERLN